MKASLTLSANAGVALEIGGHRIWVDALHDRKEPKFSTVSRQLQQQMLQSEAFRHPQYICYTHCHPDHYSESLTEAALRVWPKAKVLAPEGKFAAFSGNTFALHEEDLSIRFLLLPHEGSQYVDVRHFGLIVSVGEKNILIPGDCAVASEELLRAVEKAPIHLMLLDFPWMTLPRGRAFLDAHFSCAEKVLLHLPFAEDDRFGYRVAAQRAAERSENVHLLCDPLQTLTLEI